MGFSSEQARTFPFSGTEFSYDVADVERFRKLVVAALTGHEMAANSSPSSAADASGDLVAAQRARQRAVELAERMMREVMGASGDGVGGLEVWQEAAVLRALAEEELEFANEEARRLPATALAERDEIRRRYAEERIAVRRELQTELQASRAAALAEAESIRETARSEGTELLKKALAEAESKRLSATEETRRLERRMGMLQAAVADAEARFRRLAALAANELGTLSALADQDIAASDSPADSGTDLTIGEVDLRDRRVATDAPVGEGRVESETSRPAVDDESVHIPRRDPEVGFYQRRLAGLRDRLEKSGHPPE